MTSAGKEEADAEAGHGDDGVVRGRPFLYLAVPRAQAEGNGAAANRKSLLALVVAPHLC